MSVALLTVVRNEEAILRELLTHVFDLVDEYVIVDDNSDDGTRSVIENFAEEARAAGKLVSTFYSRQTAGRCEYYLEQAQYMAVSEWILRLDADERLTPEAIDHLRTFDWDGQFDGVLFTRYNYINDQLWEGLEKEPKLRLYRRGFVQYPRELHTGETVITWMNLYEQESLVIEHRKTSYMRLEDDRRYRSLIEFQYIQDTLQDQERLNWYKPADDALIGISLLTCSDLHYAKDMLDSLEETVQHPYYLCILDNGSPPDHQHYLLDRFARRDNVKIFLFPTNIGIIKGRNHIFSFFQQMPEVEAVCLLHTDMAFPPPDPETGWDWLQTLWLTMKENLNIGILSPRIVGQSEGINSPSEYRKWLTKQPPYQGNSLIYNQNIQPCLYRRVVLDILGGYDPNFPGKQGWEDWDYNNRVFDAGWQIATYAPITVWHKGMGTRSALSGANEELSLNAAYYHAKWGDRRW